VAPPPPAAAAPRPPVSPSSEPGLAPVGDGNEGDADSSLSDESLDTEARRVRLFDGVDILSLTSGSSSSMKESRKSRDLADFLVVGVSLSSEDLLALCERRWLYGAGLGLCGVKPELVEGGTK
jgi:hypothetical protein